MIDEVSSRRAEFTEWQGVTLADGNIWFLPRPRLEYVPTVIDGRFVYDGARSRFTFGAEFEWNLVAYRTATEDVERFQELAFVLADLMRLNYEIDDDQLAELLSIRLDDEEHVSAESMAMWEALATVIVLPVDQARVMLDEEERRLRDDQSGSWVTLADGQAWRFPSPTVNGLSARGFEAIEDAQQSGEVLDQASIIAGLAGASLGTAYSLTDEDIAQLLPIARDPVTGVRDATNRDMWVAVFDAVSGFPKPGNRTRQRWLKLAVVMATGNPSLDLTVEDASDLANMMVASGKFLPSHMWIESEVIARENAQQAAMFDGI